MNSRESDPRTLVRAASLPPFGGSWRCDLAPVPVHDSAKAKNMVRYISWMGLLDLLQSLFRKKQDDDGMPYSIVMLLRSPFAMSKEVLEAAAGKAFGVPYDGSHDMYFVVKSPVLTIVKARGSAIKVLEAAEPYLGNPAEVAQGFADKRLESAWIEHHT